MFKYFTQWQNYYKAGEASIFDKDRRDRQPHPDTDLSEVFNRTNLLKK